MCESTTPPHLDRVGATRPITVTARWAGPVAETWLTTLTVVDRPAALWQHGLAALIEPAEFDRVDQAYRDTDGRYVLVLNGPDGPWMRAEWPRDPAVAATWTDRTVLAADRPGAAAGPLLALTPEPDGTVRADPFPASPIDGGPLTFEFGDHPRAVRHLLRLLLTMTLDPEAADFAVRPFVFDTLVESPGMTLWPALTAPVHELRLPWPAVRALAAADLTHARRLLAVDAPPIHRYYAVLDDDRLHQVVRRSATPDGHAVDEHVAPDGAWTPSFLLTEITIGKSDRDHRRLNPDEINHHLETVRARRPADPRRPFRLS